MRYIPNTQSQRFPKVPRQKGFTLVELVVAMGLFLSVMAITASAFLGIADAHRKSQQTRAVLDNLSTVLENMTRTIRTGYEYYCRTGDGPFPPLGTVQDCAAGDTGLAFTAQSGAQVEYALSGSRIVERWKVKWPDASATSTYTAVSGAGLPITDPSITITDLTFYVHGTSFSDNVQPFVTIHIAGSVSSKGIATPINIQTTVTQRLLDLQ